MKNYLFRRYHYRFIRSTGLDYIIYAKQKAEGNPFGKEELHPATIDLLDDPNYQNIILPDELREALNNKETITVYFYSSTCEFCKKQRQSLCR